jgi:hypothetical protein
MLNNQPSMKGGCIYALADPRKPKVWRYVGRSFHPAARRTQHVGVSRRLRQGETAKEKWIADLLSNGLHPRVIVLERDIEPNVLGARERAWIVRSLRDGHPLTNALLYRSDASQVAHTKPLTQKAKN